jgi:hypothetical protein
MRQAQLEINDNGFTLINSGFTKNQWISLFWHDLLLFSAAESPGFLLRQI